MAGYCTINPEVIINGERQQSSLFQQLKQYTFNDYRSAMDLYLFAIHDTKDGDGEYITKLNQQGEPDLVDYMEKYDFRPLLKNDFEEKLMKHFGLRDDEFTIENYNNIIKLCEDLNNSIYGNHYFATVEINKTDGTIKPVLRYRTNRHSFEKQRNDQSKSVKLITKMTNLLNQWGIGIDAFNDAEERMSHNNETVDFSHIEKSADGFYNIIKIAKDERGINAIPEAFGHVVVRAMIDNPLMQRTINLIRNKNLSRDILGDQYEYYADEYDNDEDLLAEEAAGKLMAMHFLYDEKIDNDEVYASILGRTIGSAKKFFSQFNEAEISDALNEVNENISLIVDKVNSGEIKIDAAELQPSRIMYQASSDANHAKHLEAMTDKILENELKRLQIFKNDKNVKDDTIKLIDKLLKKIEANDREDAVLLYVKNASEQIVDIVKDLDRLKTNYKKMDMRTLANTLRYTRSMLYSYLNICKSLQKEIQEDMIVSPDSSNYEEIKDLVHSHINTLSNAISLYEAIAKQNAIDVFVNILGGDNLVIDKAWGTKKKAKVFTWEQLLDMDTADISWFDMWTQSASSSQSYVVKGLSKISKNAKGRARQRVLELSKKIDVLTKELERAGYKDQKWMFEVDSDGKRTGNYISKYNVKKYKDERDAYIKSLAGKKTSEKTRLLMEWDVQHPLKQYLNKQYQNLTAAQQKYYNEIMDIKAELDGMLKYKPNLLQTIKIRKDLMERVLSSDSVKSGASALWESIKENFVRNAQETEFGIVSTLRGFDGFEYKDLPTFYLSLGDNTSEEDISMDVASTLTAYAAMAIEYDEMHEVISMMENIHDVIRDSDNPISTKGDKEERERGVEDKGYKRANHNRILQRIDSFFDINVYNKYKEDEGTLFDTKIDKGKAADFMTRWSSSVNMAFNILANISNVATGMVQFKIEAVGGQFFGIKDGHKADAILTKELAGMIEDVGNRTKSSWLYTVSELFNVMQDYENEISHKDFDKKWYQRLSLNGLSMLCQHAGEFWMQHRTFMSLIVSDKQALTDKNGNKVLIKDAFEVVPIDKNNPRSGSEVVFKKGLTTKEGLKLITKEELQERAKQQKKNIKDKSLIKEGEISQYEFVDNISRLSAYLNNEMHGIYNREDAAAGYSKAIGRLVGQYRKWIVPSMQRRFKVGQYNYDIHSYTEGYYRTAAKFLMQEMHNIASKEFHIIADIKNLDDYQKANLRKAVGEIAIFAMIRIAIAILRGIDDDDDRKNNTYMMRMLEYQLYRLRTEIGAMMPGFSMVKEGVKILDSPMASVSLLEKVSQATDVFFPWRWKEIQSGRYKGWYRPFNTIVDLVPYNRDIYRTFHPEEAVKYYL